MLSGLSIAIAVVTVIITTVVWWYLHSRNKSAGSVKIGRRENSVTTALKKGQFNSAMTEQSKQFPKPHSVSEKMAGGEPAEVPAEDDGDEGNGSDSSEGFKIPADEVKAAPCVYDENGRPARSVGEAVQEDPVNKLLNNLHGKLATAALNRRCCELVGSMTEEEKQEEEEVCRQQLRRIFAVGEGIGLNEADFLDQMKELYSFGKPITSEDPKPFTEDPEPLIEDPKPSVE